MDRGLEVLQAPAVTVTVGGQDIVVQPVKLGQLPQFLRAVRPILAAVFQGGAAEFDLVALYADHGDGVTDALSIATGVPRSQVEQWTLDEALAVGRAVFEVNQDFFRNRVAPMLGQAMPPAA